jgi:trehalose 6-phosphate synthase
MTAGAQRVRGGINGEFGRVGAPAVHYLHQSYSRSELAALFRAADVMAVTPLRDGMNLVAKEYVAARTDLGGTLVLSEFAGAARELRQAYMCNPHDINSIKDAIMRAVRADRSETAKRMHSMRRFLREHGVRQWADDFLSALRTAAGEATSSGPTSLDPTRPHPTLPDPTFGGSAADPTSPAAAHSVTARPGGTSGAAR